jgi:hypothetical protein
VATISNDFVVPGRERRFAGGDDHVDRQTGQSAARSGGDQHPSACELHDRSSRRRGGIAQSCRKSPAGAFVPEGSLHWRPSIVARPDACAKRPHRVAEHCECGDTDDAEGARGTAILLAQPPATADGTWRDKRQTRRESRSGSQRDVGTGYA